MILNDSSGRLNESTQPPREIENLAEDMYNQSEQEEDMSLAFSKFKSKELEHRFRQYTLAEDKKRGVILIFAALIFLSAIFFLDYYFFGISEYFLKITTAKGLSVVISCSVFFLILKTKKENHFDFFLLFFSMGVCWAHLYIAWLRPPGYISVAVIDIIIIMAIYLIMPTRLVFKVVPCLMISIVSPSITAVVTPHELSSLIITHLAVHLIGIVFSNILNTSRRIQYSLFLNEAMLKKNLEKSEKAVLFISERLAKQNKMLKEFATRDQLTGVHNRRSLYEFAEEQWSKAVRDNEEFIIIMIDIDHFKDVNDTYGHQVGDLVLKGVAGTLDKLNRDYDRLGRWGGEEFMLFLPGATLEQASTIAERLRCKVAEARYSIAEGLEINITISLGIASKFQSDTLQLDELIDHADKALYHVKSTGRNRAYVYQE